MIIYEYPLNERIRIFLRLENLRHRMRYFSSCEQAHAHHAALTTLFEILDVASRTELKSELIQEMERQRQYLMGFQGRPGVSPAALDKALGEISSAIRVIKAVPGRLGQPLRDNEWLMAVRNRAMLPGGMSQSDLPAYHYWLMENPNIRRRDLMIWNKFFVPVYNALIVILRLLRTSSMPETYVAIGGAYQSSPGDCDALMLRVRVPRSEQVAAEISANRHVLNIRFLTPKITARPQQVERDIAFDLAFCNL